jgi:ParB-like chromosome segregation protein Spo0J
VTTDELPISSLDERYARFRIVQPAAERAVRDSMRRLGQLMPIVACERQAAFAVVDGFKRVAAARTLGIDALRARVMPLGEAAAIAALITFNRHGRGLSDLEEAMVVKALCRDEGLLQVQVAELVDRDKSWVCRRLSLAERLAEAVADDVRAGLVSTTVARELARLPRGNQAEVAISIRQHALTSHEAALLVTLFERTSGAAQQRHILDKPREALEAHGRHIAVPVYDPRLGPETQALYRRLYGVLRTSSDLCERLAAVAPAGLTAAERQVLLPVLAKMHGTAALLVDKLTEIVGAMKEK